MQRILKRTWELENVLSEEKSNKKLGFDLERERTSGERERATLSSDAATVEAAIFESIILSIIISRLMI